MYIGLVRSIASKANFAFEAIQFFNQKHISFTVSYSDYFFSIYPSTVAAPELDLTSEAVTDILPLEL